MSNPEESPSRVNRAKAKAVGGKRKRCLNGKSCSATCIERNDICLVDLPSSPSMQTTLVSGAIKGSNKKGTLTGKKKTLKSAQEFVLPSAPPAKMHRIESAEGFKAARVESGKFSKEFHDKMGRVLKVRDKDEDAVAERVAMLKRLGISEAALAKAIRTVSNYTDLDYKPVKKALYAALAGKPLTAGQKRELSKGKVIERIIAAAPKEAVPKFRGFRTDQQALEELIASAKLKGLFKDGVLSSWSTSLRVGQEFADNEKEGKPIRVIFQTINKRGMAVESITQAEREWELMTSGTAKYTHTGNYRIVPYNGETYHIFDVVEE
jgi:hypothetical protein